jgi:hypothetical protein
MNPAVFTDAYRGRRFHYPHGTTAWTVLGIDSGMTLKTPPKRRFEFAVIIRSMRGAVRRIWHSDFMELLDHNEIIPNTVWVIYDISELKRPVAIYNHKSAVLQERWEYGCNTVLLEHSNEWIAEHPDVFGDIERTTYASADYRDRLVEKGRDDVPS